VTNIQEIEQAIAQLPREDFFELVRQLRERHADEWDRQIEEDAHNGKLQALHDRLQDENRGQPETPLDDFLDEKKFP
jgi:hypothetical protein